MICRAKHIRTRNSPLRRVAAFLLSVILTASAVFLTNDGGLLIFAARAAEDDGGLSDHVIDTISPSHVKFNLFDYWVNARDSVYNNGWGIQKGINEGHPFVFGAGAGNGRWNVWTGNPDHYNAQEGNPGVRYGEYKGVVKNTLSNGYPKLDLQDETFLPNFVINNNLNSKLDESLAYLFDPDITNSYKAVYENVQGLVKYDDSNGGYVYNSHENYAAFQESASGALGTNGEPSAGYFEVYDSWALHGSTSPNGQFFPFDGADEVFEKNPDGSFQVADGHLVSKNTTPTVSAENLNHFMGMTMETVFLQPEDGKVDQSTPMSFTFSGDDDVWIFIDNVLVSDLGGIHDECFTIIDFETGMVYTGLTPVVRNADGTFSEAIPTLEELRGAETSGKEWTWYDRANRNDVKGNYAEFARVHGITSKNLREIFTEAGQDQNQTWGDGTDMNANTFDQNTQHELKMFYLERGAGASNLVLAFNMLAVPASGVTKTDQDGRPVSGAEFQLWPAQLSETEKDEYGFAAPVIDEETGLYIADKSAGTPICTATTDENGHLSFITENRKIISFQERAQDDPPQLYYVLEETMRPTGYRSKGDISLYYSIYNRETREGVLLSYNYWQTGAYTQAKLDVTMTNKLYKYTVQNGEPVAGDSLVPPGEDAAEYLDNGIIFAVPIKRMDMEASLYEESNFHALYGTTNTGWTLMTKDIRDKTSVLEAAQEMVDAMQQTRQTGTIIAERNARQLFHIEITNIPGDVKLTYPYLLGTGDVSASEYNIAFYFAPNADSLDDITDADTIVRISTVTPENDRFDRQYASQFYVSNIFNRVRVQKMDYHGNRLAGATFHMYQTYSYQDRDGAGTQYVWDADRNMYRNTAVVNSDGTLKEREEILQAAVWDKGTTLSDGSAGTGGLNLDGAIIFPTKFDAYIYGDQLYPYQVDPNDTTTYMEEGEYIILEAGTPAGYTINETLTTVTVNDSGVFADAGEINDGVRVGQYAGWILNSMSQFAAESAVDETLTFINTTLKVVDENGDLVAPAEGDITWLNKYSNENHRYIFFAEDVGRYVTTGRNLYQYTDEGTPKLLVQQNSNVTAEVLILDGGHKGYNGPVTVNKANADGSIYTLQGIATNGTLAFWLRKPEAADGVQTLESVEINGTVLQEGIDYHVYTPHVTDLSEYEDLSGLFSVETLVQVYDQNVGDLEVSKKTEHVAADSAADNEIFYYRVYGVYEQATKIVLAQTDANGDILTANDGSPILNTTFNGTLNVRLREKIEGVSTQMTATNVAVNFTNGIGILYLEPEYEVEYVYIPENEDHAGHGLIGLVETRIILDDSSVNGTGSETGRHIAFDITHHHTVKFSDGVGFLYHDPDFTIQEVSINGTVYYTDPGPGENGLEATSRFNYATIQQVLNMDTESHVAVTFTETDGTPSNPARIITQADTGPGQNVTVFPSGNDDYCMAYSLLSDTHEQAVVAQFALYAGQTIHMEGLSGGAIYYVYEYATDNHGNADRDKLDDDWTTGIAITPQGGQNGTEEITDPYEEIIPDFWAAKGVIRTNATQQVVFTNSARVGALTVSKTVTGDQVTEADRSTEFSFTVTLKDANGTPLQGIYPYTGSSVEGVLPPTSGTLTLDENGTASFSLRHGQSITILDIPKNAAYEVSESQNFNYTVTVQGDTDNDGDPDSIVLENESAQAGFTNLKRSTFTFTKVAAEDTSLPLEGARFTFYWLQCTDPEHHDHTNDLVTGAGGCWIRFSSGISDRQGKVSFSRLYENSQYRLVETKAPNGYVLPAGQWRITTDANGRITIAEVISGTHKPPAFKTDDNGNLSLPNMRPVDLPTLGNSGIIPFLIGGTLLMLISAGMILGRKLYKKHATSK